MVKQILSVAVTGLIALSGCSQKEVEVKPAVEKAVEAVEANVTAVVEKAAPSVQGGAAHVPFSEMMQ